MDHGKYLMKNLLYNMIIYKVKHSYWWLDKSDDTLYAKYARNTAKPNYPLYCVIWKALGTSFPLRTLLKYKDQTAGWFVFSTEEYRDCI